MKKKLIIAAAIAFAVFAIPYGSSALSTVSVASENNTVVTPTPAPSTKPVEEVKNAVDAIDASKITDAASADNAAVALIKIGSQDLKEAMNAGQDTVNDVAAIEAAYKKAKGIKDTTLANSGAVKAVGIVGAAFVAPDTTLSVEAPAATPEITSSTYAVTSTPVYVEISLKAGTYSVESLPIPVAVTIETPAGVDGNKAVIFHFVNGGLEEIKPIYNASANTLTFTVKLIIPQQQKVLTTHLEDIVTMWQARSLMPRTVLPLRSAETRTSMLCPTISCRLCTRSRL